VARAGRPVPHREPPNSSDMGVLALYVVNKSGGLVYNKVRVFLWGVPRPT
jgi:hypothetical protein